MKKLLLILTIATLSVGAYAQVGSKSLVVKGGYQTELKRFGVGVQGRYGVTDNIRVAPEMLVFFPKNHTTGLYFNVDAHYVFDLKDGLSLYPLAGVAMANDRFSYSGFTNSNTNFGFNLGGGLDYNLSDYSFLNAEFRYTLSDGDYATFFIGYGVKF